MSYCYIFCTCGEIYTKRKSQVIDYSILSFSYRTQTRGTTYCPLLLFIVSKYIVFQIIANIHFLTIVQGSTRKYKNGSTKVGQKIAYKKQNDYLCIEQIFNHFQYETLYKNKQKGRYNKAVY